MAKEYSVSERMSCSSKFPRTSFIPLTLDTFNLPFDFVGSVPAETISGLDFGLRGTEFCDFDPSPDTDMRLTGRC